MNRKFATPRPDLLAAAVSVALAAPAAHANGVVEELIVTATKREESSQDIPVAVSFV